MDNLPELLDILASKHMRRLLIFLFTMMVGMAIGANFAHAQTKTPAPTPVKFTAPVPFSIGTVTQADANTIGLVTEANQQISYSVNSLTKFEAPRNAAVTGKPTVKNINTGDKIAVISADNTTAVDVIILPKTAPQERKAFLGVVSSREASSSGTLLSLKSPKEDAFDKAFVTSSTRMMAKDIAKPTIDDIKAGDKVVVVGPVNSQNVIAAARLYLIPGKARGLLDKVLNPSSSPASSASAKPSAKPTASAKAATGSATRP